MGSDPFHDLFDNWQGPRPDAAATAARYDEFKPGFQRARAVRRTRLAGAAVFAAMFAAGTPVIVAQVSAPTAVVQTADDTTEASVRTEAVDGTDRADSDSETPMAEIDPQDADSPATGPREPEQPLATMDTTSGDSQAPRATDAPDDNSTDAPDDNSTDAPDDDNSTDAPDDDNDEQQTVTIPTEAGSITVELVSGELRLVEVTTQDGFESDASVDGDEIEIEFRNDAPDAPEIKIEIEIEDGTIVYEIDRDDPDDVDEDSSEG